jgi:hypothetical protein
MDKKGCESPLVQWASRHAVALLRASHPRSAMLHEDFRAEGSPVSQRCSLRDA